jgi:hypothetical protein
MEPIENKQKQDKKDTSVKDLILNIQKLLAYLLKKWVLIVALAVIGAIAGFVYNMQLPKLYNAETIFVLESKENEQAGGLALLGLGGSSSAGLFNEKDNIIWLYSSRNMLQSTLLSSVNIEGKQVLLIDLFLKECKKKGVIKANKELDKITFPGNGAPEAFSPAQNSLMSACVGLIKSKYLKVAEVKKTNNLITVNFSFGDELFAKTFAETLVATVNNFYIQTKTKKITREIEVLQGKADSTRALMNGYMYQAASSIDAVPNANPMQQVLRVNPQKKQVDIEVATAVYTELMKNIETRRMALAQETPLIQVVDAPVLPLGVNKMSGVKTAIIWGILFGMLAVLVLVLKRVYKNIMAV